MGHQGPSLLNWIPAVRLRCCSPSAASFLFSLLLAALLPCESASAQARGEGPMPPAKARIGGVGEASSPRGHADRRPRRRNPGTLLWEDRYDASPFEQAFSVATRRDRVFVAGYVENSPGRDFVVRAYDAATGILAWQDQLNKGDDDFASGVVTDAKRVFVSGTTFKPGNDYDWILRAYDADTGDLLWENTFDLAARSDFSRGTALAAGNGLVFLGGYGTNAQDVGDLNTDYIVRAHDASSGALVGRISSAASPGHTRWRWSMVGCSSVVGTMRPKPSLRSSVPTTPRQGRCCGSIRLQERRDSVGRPGRATSQRTAAGSSRRNPAGLPPLRLRPLPSFRRMTPAASTLLWRDEFDTAGAGVTLNEVDAFGGRVFAVGQGGANCRLEESNCDTVIRSYHASSGTLVWERQLNLSGADDSAELVTVDRGVVFVFSQAESTFTLPGCCVMGRWVVQAFSSYSGQLLWQAVEGDLESAVYNMAVDGGRLFIPGRSIDAVTDRWDFIVRAYDVRGQRGEIEPIFAAPPQLAVTGTSGEVSYRGHV